MIFPHARRSDRSSPGPLSNKGGRCRRAPPQPRIGGWEDCKPCLWCTECKKSAKAVTGTGSNPGDPPSIAATCLAPDGGLTSPLSPSKLRCVPVVWGILTG